MHILGYGEGMFMMDHEDAYQDEHLAVGKGLLVGVVFGSLIWAAIIGGIVLMFR
jgi:hypothetical protein